MVWHWSSLELVDGQLPEEEVLAVFDVPLGKMGLVISKKGISILEIKKSCRYLISHSSIFVVSFTSSFSCCQMFHTQQSVYNLLLLHTSAFILKIYDLLCRCNIFIRGQKGPPDKARLSFKRCRSNILCKLSPFLARMICKFLESKDCCF